MSSLKNSPLIVLGLMVIGMAGWLVYVQLDTGAMPQGWGPMQVKKIPYGHVDKNRHFVTEERALSEWLKRNELALWRDDRHPPEMEIITITGVEAEKGSIKRSLLVVYRTKNKAGTSWSPAGWVPEKGGR